MVMDLGALRAWSLAHKRAGEMTGRIGINRPDGSRSVHVHTYSMTLGSGLALSTPET